MKRNGEDQLRLDIPEDSIEDESPYQKLLREYDVTEEEVDEYAKTNEGDYRKAYRHFRIPQEKIDNLAKKSISKPLPEVDMSNVKTSYSLINTNLAERAMRLIAAAEPVAKIRRGRASKTQKRAEDLVVQEVNLARNTQMVVENSDDPYEAIYEGQRDAGKFIGRFGGPDKKVTRDEFIKVQKSRVE